MLLKNMKQFFNIFKKILNITGKFFLVISVFVIVINLFLIFTSTNREKINFSKATEQNRAEIYKVINDKKTNSTKEGKTTIAWYRVINCAFIGEACTNNPSDGNANFNGSVFGYITQGIALPYLNPPASGVYWVYDTLQNNNLVPKSYAAEGIGFSALRPLIGLWKIFRNVAYMILVSILIVIGFMIMFRVKINPQTVVSLENSLPRIVVTLLLITFSFPIAGFMIDLMYIIMAIGINLFSGYIDIGKNIGILSGNSWSLWDEVFWNGDIWSVGPALFEILPASTGYFLRLMVAFISILLLNLTPIGKKILGTEFLKNTITMFEGLIQFGGAFIVNSIIFGIIVTIVPLIISFIVLLSALVVFFRIFFLLFKSYIKILLLIIFSPLILLLDAIPGKKMFLMWLKNMTSNLIAFPIISTLIILSSVITALDSEGKLWTPPFLYSNQSSPILVLVSIGILFMIPDIVKVVRAGLGIKEGGLNIGSGLFFGGITGAAKTAMNPISQLGSLAMGATSIRNFFDKRKGGGPVIPPPTTPPVKP